MCVGPAVVSIEVSGVGPCAVSAGLGVGPAAVSIGVLGVGAVVVYIGASGLYSALLSIGVIGVGPGEVCVNFPLSFVVVVCKDKRIMYCLYFITLLLSIPYCIITIIIELIFSTVSRPWHFPAQNLLPKNCFKIGVDTKFVVDNTIKRHRIARMLDYSGVIKFDF